LTVFLLYLYKIGLTAVWDAANNITTLTSKERL